jgi:hypothetical protein
MVIRSGKSDGPSDARRHDARHTRAAAAHEARAWLPHSRSIPVPLPFYRCSASPLLRCARKNTSRAAHFRTNVVSRTN